MSSIWSGHIRRTRYGVSSRLPWMAQRRIPLLALGPVKCRLTLEAINA